MGNQSACRICNNHLCNYAKNHYSPSSKVIITIIITTTTITAATKLYISTRVKNHQLVARLIKTGCNNIVLHLLFTIVNTNIVREVLIKMNNIVQCCLTTVNNRCSTILLQVVVQQARNFWLCRKRVKSTSWQFTVLKLS